MIQEGEAAPTFELPAVVDGDVDRVALEDYLGQQVVILAFYPGDFNPACRDGTTDLDELDLFTMQKDVSILAISADSVYAHEAFADEFDLHIPLLSDPRGEVASDYGVAVDDPRDGHLVDRAVVVVGLDGTVEFAWSTESLTELPPVERIRASVDSIGGERTAEARYGVGHAHYVEGRRQFTSAMNAFQDEEWMMARADFEQAEAEFSEAADEFNTAVRFAEDEDVRTYFERAEDKAEALWQAAEWLAESANAYASGEGAEGASMREDAEGPLETARDIHEPVAPEEFPPEEDPADHAGDEAEQVSILPSDEEEVDATLEIDVDDAAGPDEAVDLDEGGADAAGDPAAAGEATATDPETGEADEEEEGEDDIDEAELEEITAELEQQSEEAAAEADDAEAESEAGVAEAAGAGEAVAGDEVGQGEEGLDWDADPTGIGGTVGEAGGASPPDEGPEPAGSTAERGGAPESGSAPADESEDATPSDEVSDRDGDQSTDEGPASEGPDSEDSAEEDLELDLTDPSEGEDQLLDPEEREVDEDGEAEVLEEVQSDVEDEEEDGDSDDEDPAGSGEDLGDGDHGVPDSL